MNVEYYPMDPAFEGRNYPEHGTAGYDGPGWYVIDYRGLVGPFDSEEEANRRLKDGTD